jgi:hypothetical protein
MVSRALAARLDGHLGDFRSCLRAAASKKRLPDVSFLRLSKLRILNGDDLRQARFSLETCTVATE